jgi:hypothetical protein
MSTVEVAERLWNHGRAFPQPRDKDTLVEPLQPSDPTNIGRYRITGRLGTGGMGSVYLGLSPGGRPAAVKMIHANFQRDPEALARFRREVETLRTVRSAYTAALIDSEVDHAPYWLATEYVPGPTLHASVNDNGAFSTTACYGLFAALAEGLTDIHEHGVCHRDLKPQNVILAATGPQLIDFGIARGTEQTGLTQVGHAVGTPGYTAPEVLTHNQVGPAADVFALGVTIGFVATGRPPYGSGTFTAVSMRILDAKIELPGVDPGLAGLIRACVAVDPADRPTPEQIIEACHRLSPTQIGPTTPSGALAGRTSVMPAQPGRGTASMPVPGRPRPGAAQVPGQPSSGAAQVPGHVSGQPVSRTMPMAGQPISRTAPMAGQYGQGKASVPIPGQPMSGAAQAPGQAGGRATPANGQFGQGKASVPTPTAYQPVTRYDAAPEYPAAGGYQGRPPEGPSSGGRQGHPPASGQSRRSMVLLSGLGVLIVVLLVVVLIRVSGNNDPEPSAAAAVTPTQPATAPTTRPTTQQAAPPPPTQPTTEPTAEKTQDQDQDDDDDDQGGDGAAGTVAVDGENLCVEMPKNAAPLDKVKILGCTGKDSQRWTYTSWNGLKQGDMCLDMGPDNQTPGASRTRVYPCNQTNTQQFKQDANGTVSNPGTGLCLSVGDGDDGAGMSMTSCDGAAVWDLPQQQG